MIIVGITFPKVQEGQKPLEKYKRKSKKSENMKLRLNYLVKYGYSKFKNTLQNIGLYAVLLSFFVWVVLEPLWYKEVILEYKNYPIIMHSTVIFTVLWIVWNYFEVLKRHIKNSVPDSKDRLSITITIIATVVSIIALLK